MTNNSSEHMEQIAETIVYDYGDETEIEIKYEKYREDQRNTGVIAALVGGFALSNSWNLNIEMEENVSYVELASYTLAILAVHGCTCSALVSAFLYRSITRVKSPTSGVAWVERHPILVQLPWYKFLFGTASYLISVLLVAWTTLQFNTVSRIITFVGGLFGFFTVIFTLAVVLYDSCDCEVKEQQHRRTDSITKTTDDNTTDNTSDSINKIPIQN